MVLDVLIVLVLHKSEIIGKSGNYVIRVQGNYILNIMLIRKITESEKFWGHNTVRYRLTL